MPMRLVGRGFLSGTTRLWYDHDHQVKVAWNNFQNFGKGYQNTYIFWVNYAKREETKKKKMQIVLERAKKNIPPGIM